METSLHMKTHQLIGNTIPLITVLKSNNTFSKIQKPVKISCKKMSMQSCSDIERPDFYRLLSLNYSQNAGFDEVKKAYKKMALQYHPDVCSPTLTKDESMKRFIELREAYETLSDQYSREICDFFELNSGSKVEKRRAGGERFPREVWERQLDGLKKRCHEKLEKRGLFT